MLPAELDWLVGNYKTTVRWVPPSGKGRLHHFRPGQRVSRAVERLGIPI
ncbi:hypothetical protein THTE_2874 [Thermogutta terrifontis]|uniref:Uncharacterized protein n=1 Tax=Thermogutta terrifontis TaxID=1331910 RepID=A0A286RHS5_9BACT|nr:hypothetical protein THTE_2874 [Thermogutta terrifontis]